MIMKREVTVDGAGLVLARGAVCGEGFIRPITGPAKVLQVFPSVRRWNIAAVPYLAEPGPADVWETAGYLALWACGLLGIGLCLM